MTQEQYLALRNQNMIGNIVYEFYRESEGRKDPPLDPNSFTMVFSMYPGNKRAAENVLRHYDSKFNIFELKDKNGKILKYYV